MYILGIDTSCDDTCISVLNVKCQSLNVKTCSFEILSNIVSSQAKLHAKYGGVYPFLAKREHQRNLAPVLKKALQEARLLKSKIKSRAPRGEARDENEVLSEHQKSKIDVIGVTVGPGLEPCLWQGVNFAKELAKKLKRPLIPVNHIEAHILANWLSTSPGPVKFPAICLVVSGGHTQLILMREIKKYKILGETRDDAAGECFDKVAKILGLGYPGGPVVDKQAQLWRAGARISKLKIQLPRPMIYQKNYDFSFSGLKTAVLYDFRSRSTKIKKSPKESLRLPTGQAKIYIQEMAKEVQQAIVDVLISKTIRAAKEFRAKTIILGGGVAASQELRNQFKTKCLTSNVKFLVPPKNLCTDNAVMIGVAAFYHQDKTTFDLEKIEVDANLKI